MTQAQAWVAIIGTLATLGGILFTVVIGVLRLGRAFGRLEEKVDGIDGKLLALEARLTARIDRLALRLDAHLERHGRTA
jgi:hypothetical protein